MPFKKGNPGKPKGAIRKDTKILKEFLVEISEKGKDKMWEELQKLQGKDYVHSYLTMLEYVRPKLARTELANDQESPLFEKNLTYEQLYELKYGRKPK